MGWLCIDCLHDGNEGNSCAACGAAALDPSLLDAPVDDPLALTRAQPAAVSAAIPGAVERVSSHRKEDTYDNGLALSVASVVVIDESQRGPNVAAAWPITYANAQTHTHTHTSKPTSTNNVDGTRSTTYNAAALCKSTAPVASSSATGTHAAAHTHTHTHTHSHVHGGAQRGSPAVTAARGLQDVRSIPAASAARAGPPRNPWEAFSAPVAQGLARARVGIAGGTDEAQPSGSNPASSTVMSAACVPLSAEASSTWEFPVSAEYVDRQYQLEIVSIALFHNTLVSLPTGLGKTFIAAVVMHNFYRWFPSGQIVFIAPTRPLVTQQIEACFRIVGMAPTDTAQMQGHTKATDRALFWKERRVFYCTPQTFSNDLAAGRADASRIVLVVLDEAHRATKSHAYVQCIRALDARKARYRVLALSATPGSDLTQVADVMSNLHISRIEVRTHDDPSVAKYRNETTVDKIVVPLSKDIEDLKTKFSDIMAMSINLLARLEILPHLPPNRLGTLQLLKAREAMTKARREGSGVIGKASEEHFKYASGHLSLLMSYVPAMRELQTHGTRAFLQSLQRIEETSETGRISRARHELVASPAWKTIMMLLASMEVSGSHTTHPKLAKLCEVLVEHFRRKAKAGIATRAIVFTQTRSSVDEILQFFQTVKRTGVIPYLPPSDAAQTTLTSFLQPESGGKHDTASTLRMLRPAAFVGQARSQQRTAAPSKRTVDDGEEESDEEESAAEAQLEQLAAAGDDDATAALAVRRSGTLSATAAHTDAGGHVSTAARGQTQKEQVATIDAFRRGEINVLVATCIGEEGLDIGEVGIIVMYDAVASPIRMIQRLGRTGRKTAGECVSLVTAAESEKFEESFRNYRRIAVALKQRADSFKLYDEDPIMVSVSTAHRSTDIPVRYLPDPGPDYCAVLAGTLAKRALPPLPAPLVPALMEHLTSGAFTCLPGGVVLPRMVKSLLSGGEYHASQVAGLGRVKDEPSKELVPPKGKSRMSRAKVAASQDEFIAAFATDELEAGADGVMTGGILCRRLGCTAGDVTCDTVTHHMSWQHSLASRTVAALQKPVDSGAAAELCAAGEKLLWSSEPKLMAITIDSTRAARRLRTHKAARDTTTVSVVDNGVQSTVMPAAASSLPHHAAPTMRQLPPATTAAAVVVPLRTLQRPASPPRAPKAVPSGVSLTMDQRVTRQRVFEHAAQKLLDELGVERFGAMSFNQVVDAISDMSPFVMPPKDTECPQSRELRVFCRSLLQRLLAAATEAQDRDEPPVPEPVIAHAPPTQSDDKSVWSAATEDANAGSDDGGAELMDVAHSPVAPRVVTIVSSPAACPEQEVSPMPRASLGADGVSKSTFSSTQPVVRKRRRLAVMSELPETSPAQSSPPRLPAAALPRPSKARRPAALPSPTTYRRQAEEARERYVEGAARGGGADSGSDTGDGSDVDSDAEIDADAAMNEYDLNDSFIDDDTQDMGSGLDGTTRSAAKPGYHVRAMMMSQSSNASGSPTAALGKIRGRGAKSMPLVSRLLHHVMRGDEIVGDDSEIGSSLEDKASDNEDSFVRARNRSDVHDEDVDDDDMPLSMILSDPRPAGVAGRRRSSAAISCHPHHRCNNCDVTPIPGLRYDCMICVGYTLCADCHKHRGVIHTEELGFDRHAFKGIAPGSSEAAPVVGVARRQADHHQKSAQPQPVAPIRVTSVAAVAVPHQSSTAAGPYAPAAPVAANSARALPPSHVVTVNRPTGIATVPGAAAAGYMRVTAPNPAPVAPLLGAAQDPTVQAARRMFGLQHPAPLPAAAALVQSSAAQAVTSSQRGSQGSTSASSNGAPADDLRALIERKRQAAQAKLLARTSSAAASAAMHESGPGVVLGTIMMQPVAAATTTTASVSAHSVAQCVAATAPTSSTAGTVASSGMHPPRTRAEAQVRNLMREPGMTEPFARLVIAWLGSQPFSAVRSLGLHELQRFASEQMPAALADVSGERAQQLLAACHARAGGALQAV